tara:strand:+ start:2213 stop:3073 length:861 start_codon:yes stop_codon:yes gene_type:complete
MIGLLGASGYVGSEFKKQLISRDLEFVELSRETHDYYHVPNLITALEATNVDLLINCAGYTGKPNVDAVEDNKDVAYKANVDLARNIANVCYLGQIKLVHISSGCIYEGDNGGKGYTENDPPNFTFETGSYYSGTKALAETLVSSILPSAYICRLRIPFNSHDNERNYLTKLMKYDKLLKATNSISHLGDFVDCCINLFFHELPSGTYNIVNTGTVTTEYVAEKIKALLNLDKNFKYFSDDEEFYKIGARAPRSNCVLDNSKLLSTGITIRTTEEALTDSLENWHK